MVGRLDVGVMDILGFWRHGLSADTPLQAKQLAFWYVRLPRCLMAVLVGVGLSLSGAVYQALFRNPLVSPDILGVAAGCTFGAALGLMLPGEGLLLVRSAAFAFGLAAVFCALGIARLVAVKPILVLVLAGLVVTSLFNALLMCLKYLADPYSQLPSIVFWVMGSLNRVSWADLLWTAPVVLGGALMFHLLRYRLNVLSLGDLQARALGVHPGRLRLLFIAVSSLMVALIVSTCGQVCWIGLVVPHIARTLVGANHEAMVPAAALIGALFMLAADALARSLTTAELPVSILTALAGAPLFAYLLYRNRGSGW